MSSILDCHCEVGEPLRSESQEVNAAAALAGVHGFGVNNMGLPMLRGKKRPALAFAHPGVLLRRACRGRAMPVKAPRIDENMQRL